MMIPSRLSCSPRSTLSRTAAFAMVYSGNQLFVYTSALGVHNRGDVVHFDARVVLHAADGLVAARDDGVARLQTSQHLDIRRTGDTCFHLVKFGMIALGHKDALDRKSTRL